MRRNLGSDPDARWTQAGQAMVLPDGNAVWLVPEAAPVDPTLAALLELHEPLYRSLDKPGFAVYALPESVPTDFFGRSAHLATLSRFSVITLSRRTIGRH